MRALFSCVAENKPAYWQRVYSLALSIRRFGGALADSPIVVAFLEGVDPEVERRLATLDARVKVVDRVYPPDPYANKLRMLELHEDNDFDVLVALDCDMVLLGDPSRFLSTEGVSGKPADIDLLRPRQWRALFDILSLPVPPRRYSTTTSGQRTYPYFNTGVLLVPSAMSADLHEVWLRYVFGLERVFQQRADIAGNRFHNNQIAFTCALAAGGFRFRVLPTSMNFSTNLVVHRDHKASALPPLVAHYHGLTTEEGFIHLSAYPEANERIEAFNRALAEDLGVAYRPLPEPGRAERMKQHLRGRVWYHRPSAVKFRAAAKRAVPSI
jgi:hypothetical protein